MEIILKYFPALSSLQTRQFSELGKLYQDWNYRVNLISRKDIANLYERHILHSLSIAKVIDFTTNTTVTDIGTGGGLPGIPLAIFFPNVNFNLVDSITKKITACRAISESLELKNITTLNCRSEHLNNKCDFVIARAVATIPIMIALAKKIIKPRSFNKVPNGLFLLKGGDLTRECEGIRNPVKEISINQYFKEEFFETKKIIYIQS